MAVSLACRLDSTGAEHSGTVVNVGFGGLGIELEADANLIELMAPHTVIVDELGAFEVETRWSRGNRIGVRFTDEVSAKASVQGYLDANGLALP